MSVDAHVQIWLAHLAPLVHAIPWSRERSSARSSGAEGAVGVRDIGGLAMRAEPEQDQDPDSRWAPRLGGVANAQHGGPAPSGSAPASGLRPPAPAAPRGAGPLPAGT